MKSSQMWFRIGQRPLPASVRFAEVGECEMSACCRFAFSSAPTGVDGVDIPRPRSTTLLFNNSRTSEISFWGKPSSNRAQLSESRRAPVSNVVAEVDSRVGD